MELQWELILFTTLIAWSAGLFGAQALAAAFGQAKKSQMISWIVAAALLVAGGIAVFLHLKHPEKIFNGFGNLTSGITQELIAIVLLVLVAVAYLVFLRRSEDGASVPKWLAFLAVLVSAALIVVMAHSYIMSARPAWDTFIWIAYVLGNALVLGPATLVVIMALNKEEKLNRVGSWVVVGAAVNLALAVAYGLFAQNVGGSFAEVGYYFDPTHPTKGMTSIASVQSAQTLLLWLGGVGAGAALPLIVALAARIKGGATLWMVCGSLAVVCSLVGAIALRMVFYNLGLSVFMFY